MNPDPAKPDQVSGWRLARFLPRNLIGQAGLALALISAGNIAVFTLIDLISEKPNPYVGILAYMVAPGFLVFSLALIGLGVWRERKRRAEGVARYPSVDLNDPSTRSAVLAFGSFLIVFVLLSTVYLAGAVAEEH